MVGLPAIKVLGEGHLANVWIFLSSSPQQGGVPPLGSYLWNTNPMIWHPTNMGKVDSLLAAQVDVYLLQLRLSSAVTQSFDNKFLSYM
jgi:hypothetical protein